MSETTDQIIMTTKPSIKAIGFGLVGILFFGTLAYIMQSSKWNISDGTDHKTGIVIMWIILGTFIFFSTVSLWAVLNSKTVILTTKALIIKRPFLLLKKTIQIDNIKRASESSFEINPTVRGTKYNVYNGNQILIECHKGNPFKLNSFEIPEYYTLTKSLRKLIRNNKINSNDFVEYPENKKQGYGWLISIGLLTCVLVYSIIRQKFF